MPSTILRDGPPESAGMDPARIDRLRALAVGWVKSGETQCVALLVARRGVVVLHEAFGMRHPDDTTPTLKRDSIFPVASVAKPITASLVMCLVEDGLIGLNRPVIEYIPELDVPGVPWLEEVRVADLLCHTSGYDDLQLLDWIAEAARKTPDLPPPVPGQHPAINRQIRLAVGAPLAARPGTVMDYANFNFNLLGDLVRRLSGRSLSQFACERLFAPLGMHDTAYVLGPALRSRRVYRGPGMPWLRAIPGLHGGGDTPEFDALDAGSGGLTSTAGDLGVFLQMLLNGGVHGEARVLSPASVAAMTRNQVSLTARAILTRIDPTTGKRVEIEFPSVGYGYGLFLFNNGTRWRSNGALQSPSAFAHTGYAGTYVWTDPAYDLVGVFLGVARRLHRDGFPESPTDCFQNAVYGAIVE